MCDIHGVEFIMSDLFAMLSAKASMVIPGREYNTFRGQASASKDGSWQQPPLHFEDALPLTTPKKALAERIMPSWVRFLDRKKQDPEHPRDVLVALFLGESCFLLRDETLLDVYRELEGIGTETLRQRIRGWLGEDG